MSLSLGMIVRNEEKMLRLTQSLPFIDQFQTKIALDTGSTDGTIKLLRERGWSVFERPWQNDYSLARNQLLDISDKYLKPIDDSPSWMLMLDADECIWPYDYQFLWTQCLTAEVDLISLPRINLAGHGDIQEVGSYPDAQSRCVRVGSPVKYRLPVHEVADFPYKFVEHVKIFHYGWCKSSKENWLRSHNYKMISEGKPTLTETPEWVSEISVSDYWKDMGQRHKLEWFDKDHPLKGKL